MTLTVGLHCCLVPLASAQSGPTSVQLSGWPLDLVPRKLGAMCMLAPPRPASATSLDCSDEGLSPNFGSLNLLLGPVLPASSQLALPVAFKGSSVICLGFFEILLLVESVPNTEHTSRIAGAGKMVQRVRILASLVEDLGLIHRISRGNSQSW